MLKGKKYSKCIRNKNWTPLQSGKIQNCKYFPTSPSFLEIPLTKNKQDGLSNFIHENYQDKHQKAFSYLLGWLLQLIQLQCMGQYLEEQHW